MIEKIKGILSNRGTIMTLLLSAFFLIYFYGKLLQHPNEVYFGATGDGLQTYYNAIYHVKNDDSFLRTNGMNYPYGETVFFASCQPLVTNAIKIISYVVDISNYTVGIINLIMLFSIVLSALFIFFIFKHLRLPHIYAAISATAIAFLSPQINRMGGHYTLTYEFAIPLYLLLLLKFYEWPSLKKSIVIGVFTFCMATTHLYFFGFFGFFAFFYWSVLFFTKTGSFGKLKFAVKHFSIQTIIPFALIQVIMHLSDTVHDRTAYPWGYLVYISNLTGVFFPTQRFYTPFFESFIKPDYPEWEGVSFVGIIAVVCMLGIVLNVLRKLLSRNFKQLFMVTNDALLNSFFWASIVSLLLAFGYPFKIEGWDYLLNYSGPLKQFRGIGRFAWMFYYVINIIAIYKIYNWAKNKKIFLQYGIYIVVLFFISYDAYIVSYEIQNRLDNPISELIDRGNKNMEDRWFTQIDPNQYQAIIPLPYFHIGSENIWLFRESEIVKDVFIASLKTGLPITAVALSRVSLSQTYKNIQLIKEPYRKLEIVNEFKSTKPFLVLVRENELNKDEQKFLTNCKKIKDTPDYSVYQLETETLKHISDHLYEDAVKKLKGTKTTDINGFKSTDSLQTFYYCGYENKLNAKSYSGRGCYEGHLLEYNTLFLDTIPNWKNEEYTVSFWMDDFTKDLYPRLTVELAFLDSTGNMYGTSYYGTGEKLRVLDGKWGLIESTFSLKSKKDKLKVTVWTKDYLDKKMILRADELLIKPLKTDVYKNKTAKSITINNRTYLAK